MILPYIPVLIMIAGLLLYILCSNSKAQELGRIMFFVGLFFTVAIMAGSAKVLMLK